MVQNSIFWSFQPLTKYNVFFSIILDYIFKSQKSNITMEKKQVQFALDLIKISLFCKLYTIKVQGQKYLHN